MNWNDATDAERIQFLTDCRTNRMSWVDISKIVHKRKRDILKYRHWLPERLQRKMSSHIHSRESGTYRSQVFALLDKDKSLQHGELADLVGCALNTASYYRSLWLRRENGKDQDDVIHCPGCGLIVERSGFCWLCIEQQQGRVVLYR